MKKKIKIILLEKDDELVDKKLSMKVNIPSTSQLEKELNREKYKNVYMRLLKSTIYVLLIVVSFSILVSTFLFQVLEIYGESMDPTLNEGDIVVNIRKSKYKKGDIIAFYYNNQILVKRVIAVSSEWVNIDSNGNVFVNDELVEEDYLDDKFLGNSDINYPYQVPEGAYFVLGDEREKSVDSRSSLIGAVLEDEIIGKVVFRVWPIDDWGIVK